MTTNTFSEQQLQADIEQLKIQFPQTRDLYREVCVLLFFLRIPRDHEQGLHGIVNKVYAAS